MRQPGRGGGAGRGWPGQTCSASAASAVGLLLDGPGAPRLDQGRQHRIPVTIDAAHKGAQLPFPLPWPAKPRTAWLGLRPPCPWPGRRSRPRVRQPGQDRGPSQPGGRGPCLLAHPACRVRWSAAWRSTGSMEPVRVAASLAPAALEELDVPANQMRLPRLVVGRRSTRLQPAAGRSGAHAQRRCSPVHGAAVAINGALQRIAEVAQQMPAIRDLHRFRRALAVFPE